MVFNCFRDVHQLLGVRFHAGSGWRNGIFTRLLYFLDPGSPGYYHTLSDCLAYSLEYFSGVFPHLKLKLPSSSPLHGMLGYSD